MELHPIRLKTKRRLGLLVAAAASIGLAGAIGAITAPMIEGEARCASLMSESVASDVDWPSLGEINEPVAGVIAFEGGGYARPIVAPGESGDDFKLDHDFWENESPQGCPTIARMPGLDGVEVSEAAGGAIAASIDRAGAADAILSTVESGGRRLAPIGELDAGDAAAVLGLRGADAEAVGTWRESALARSSRAADRTIGMVAVIWHREDAPAGGLLLCEE